MINNLFYILKVFDKLNKFIALFLNPDLLLDIYILENADNHREMFKNGMKVYLRKPTEQI